MGRGIWYSIRLLNSSLRLRSLFVGGAWALGGDGEDMDGYNLPR
jgi:hypothetical protein